MGDGNGPPVGILVESQMARLQLERVLDAGGFDVVVLGDASPPPTVALAVVGPRTDDLALVQSWVTELATGGRPVLLMVGEHQRGLIEAAQQWPVAGVVLRPFRSQVFLAMVRELTQGSTDPSREAAQTPPDR